MKSLFTVLLLLLCSSCRYKNAALAIGDDKLIEMSIPVIKKDPNGILRNALAREISFNKSLYYKTEKAKYNLNVSIEEDKDSIICFMWDRNPKTNKGLNVFYNTEGMKEVVAKIELVDANTKDVVIGPVFLRQRSIYDFVNPTVAETLSFEGIAGNEISALQYSLGQLDSEEGAKEATYIPTYQNLAKKIVTCLIRTRKKSIR